MENFYFENRCTGHKKMMEDYLRLKVEKLVLLRALVAVVAVVYALLRLFMWRVSRIEDLLQLALCVEAFVLITFAPQIGAWLSVKKSERKYGGTITETMVRFGEIIEANYHKGEEAVEYSDVVAVYHLPESYALQISKNRVLFLDCDGFTKGTFEEFKKFLRTKRPDLVIPE